MQSNEVALCVDLDGTLVRSDLLYESVLLLLARNPLYVFLLPIWLLKGRAALKRSVASRVQLQVENLPYDARVLELLRTTAQRPRVLCSASDRTLANAVADHLGLFDEVIASDGRQNLAGGRKAQALNQRFGLGQYDYMGNARIDLSVWKHAAGAYVVNAGESLAASIPSSTPIYAHWVGHGSGVRTWIRALRIYQWAKNLLVLVPLLTAHRYFDLVAIAHSLTALASFGLCASGVYLLNDLLDLDADRRHPRKRLRPFAAGDIPLLQGMLAAPLLTAAGLLVALWINPLFAAVLTCYYVLTLAYSLILKRMVIVDVVTLSGLYTLRIVGGAVAIGADLSFWLLAFSMFIFLSLALIKRYTELASVIATGQTSVAGRDYMATDAPMIQSLGASSGYISTLVFALYINSADSLAHYHSPRLLWLLFPGLLYWISRIWIIAHRGGMHDDPIVFAARDRVSWLVAIFSIAIVSAAMIGW